MPSKKAAPKTRNLTRHVSLYLNLEKPVLTIAFQEKIEDVAHLLDEEQSILATPTNTLTIHFWDIFLDFVLIRKQSTEAKTWPSEPNIHLWPQQLNFAV